MMESLANRRAIAAALSGCFNMKLAFVLNENGYNPDELVTDAELTFIDGQITLIEMGLNGKVPNLKQSTFEEFADDAKIIVQFLVF